MSQTTLGVVSVHLQVALDDRLQKVSVLGPQCVLLQENLAQGLGLVEHPRMHRCNQGVSTDEVHLQGQDTEEQVAVRVGARY
jgi:hypothetical protein